MEDGIDISVPEAEPIFLALPADLMPAACAGNGTAALGAALGPALSVACTGVVSFVAATDLYSAVPSAAGGELVPTLALPLVWLTLGLQAVHEVGHLLGAARHGLSISPPLLLPSATFGCIGGHSPLASYPANRTCLYDYALAGPVLGGAASLLALGAGLALTATASAEVSASFPQLPTAALHGSLFGSLLTELALGAPSAAEPTAAVALHPLSLAGLGALISNALALLPIGRLDGGRAATAAYGRRSAGALGGLSLVLVVIAAVCSTDRELLPLWIGFSLLLFRQGEVPCVDEISPVDERRTTLLAPLLLFAAFVLCPAPVGEDTAASFASDVIGRSDIFY